jgi:hypothetical protein
MHWRRTRRGAFSIATNARPAPLLGLLAKMLAASFLYRAPQGIVHDKGRYHALSYVINGIITRPAISRWTAA